MTTTDHGRLPAARATLIGREKELHLLGALMRGRERLVTLVGPPGVGKTQLALEAGRRMQASGAPTTVLAQLHDVRHAKDLALAVARALGLAEGKAWSVEAVGMALAELGPVVLVLDNFEQLCGVAERTVGRWLDLAPALRVLVTSRQALAIAGEQRLEVRPLAEPDALRLFVARARSISQAFEETELVRDLVRQLDGLPLAIELCARRAAVLGITATRQQMHALLDLLELDGQQLDPRHASLRRTLARSWSLLDEDEQRALCACSLFDGEVTVEGLAAVLGSEPAAPRLIQALRERSLLREVQLRRGSATETCFRLPRCVRAYGREQLARLDDSERFRGRYAAHFCQRGEAWAARVLADDSGEVHGTLLRELGNLLSAWAYMAAQDPARAVRMALVIHEAWGISGPHDPHRRLLDAAVHIAREHLPSDALCCRILLARADTLIVAREMKRAAEDITGALSVARALGNRALEAEASRMMGVLLRDQGAFEPALEHLERAAVIFTRLDDVVQLGRTVANLGTLHRQRGRPKVARACYQRALELHRQGGDPRVEGHTLAGLGHLEAAAGNREAAIRWYNSALRLLVPIGDLRTVGIVLDAMATLALEENRAERSLALLDEARTQLSQVGDSVAAALVEAHRGAALAASGQREAAWDALRRVGPRLERSPDRRLADSAAAAWGCLWVAEAEAAERQGDTHSATELRRLARRSALATSEEESASAVEDMEAHEEYAGQARRLLRAMLKDSAGSREPARGPGPAPIRVGPEGRWIRLPAGEQVELERTPVLARLVDVLARHKVEHPDAPISAEALVAAVWPDEQLEPATAKNRLYVAIAKLRGRGLDGVIIRQAGGYLLNPALACVLEDASFPFPPAA
jgi:predicted ATPase